ncbi:MAG: glycine--tRNA ligase subunit alpha [Caulobacteraceae bacterium]
MTSDSFLSFQDLILRLHAFWGAQGCVILQPYDMEVGAGTLHPATVLRALGPAPWRAAYVQPSRRPSDGRHGDNPNRLRQFHQYQVILKPNPPEMQEMYLASLEAVGIDCTLHDIRFVEDDWENPTVGAWGLGWEVWCDGMEISQYTYFQQVAGLDVWPVSGEITYGLERLALHVQGVGSVYDLAYNDPRSPDAKTYGEVFLESEREFSAFEQEIADVTMLKAHFADVEAEVPRLLAGFSRAGRPLALPAYDMVLKASHLFNLLDARGAIAVAERQGYIGRVRDLCKACALAWVAAEGAN